VEWYNEVAGNSFLQGAITSIGMFGAMFGSITCFSIADHLGRRRILIIAAMLFFCGAIVEYLSGAPGWSGSAGITVLITGRIIYGYACGFAMHGAPAYIGEMAPYEIRGLLISLKEAFIVTGK
jgi:MFS family permease